MQRASSAWWTRSSGSGRGSSLTPWSSLASTPSGMLELWRYGACLRTLHLGSPSVSAPHNGMPHPMRVIVVVPGLRCAPTPRSTTMRTSAWSVPCRTAPHSTARTWCCLSCSMSEPRWPRYPLATRAFTRLAPPALPSSLLPMLQHVLVSSLPFLTVGEEYVCVGGGGESGAGGWLVVGGLGAGPA